MLSRVSLSQARQENDELRAKAEHLTTQVEDLRALVAGKGEDVRKLLGQVEELRAERDAYYRIITDGDNITHDEAVRLLREAMEALADAPKLEADLTDARAERDRFEAAVHTVNQDLSHVSDACEHCGELESVRSSLEQQESEAERWKFACEDLMTLIAEAPDIAGTENGIEMATRTIASFRTRTERGEALCEAVIPFVPPHYFTHRAACARGLCVCPGKELEMRAAVEQYRALRGAGEEKA